MIKYDYDMMERPSAPNVCSVLLLSGADPVANGGTEFGIQSGVSRQREDTSNPYMINVNSY